MMRMLIFVEIWTTIFPSRNSRFFSRNNNVLQQNPTFLSNRRLLTDLSHNCSNQRRAPDSRRDRYAPYWPPPAPLRLSAHHPHCIIPTATTGFGHQHPQCSRSCGSAPTLCVCFRIFFLRRHSMHNGMSSIFLEPVTRLSELSEQEFNGPTG